MYAIVTTINPDGTFDTVGMNRRTVVSDLKTEKGVMARARKYARGQTFRVDFYFDQYSHTCRKSVLEATVKPPVKETL